MYDNAFALCFHLFLIMECSYTHSAPLCDESLMCSVFAIYGYFHNIECVINIIYGLLTHINLRKCGFPYEPVELSGCMASIVIPFPIQLYWVWLLSGNTWIGVSIETLC